MKAQRIKRYLFIFCCSLFYVGSSLSQITWVSKSDMPTARKEIVDAATVLDGKIYVLGGKDASGNISNVFECYDPVTDSWTTLTPYPIAVWRASTEAVGGKIYGMGGYESLNPFPFAPTNKAFVYDPATDSWSSVQNLLVERGSAASVVLDGKIHLIGGANNAALNAHHIYDPNIDNWSVAATINAERSGLTASVIEGKIYAAGGYFLSGGVVSLSSAEVFEVATNTWSFIASMPFTKLGISSAEVENKMYVFGNENNTNVLEYDVTTDSWSELEAMPENVNFAGAVSLNNTIYLIGGGAVNLTADGINAVNCFSPVTVFANELESETGGKLEVYPNPAKDRLTIESNTSELLSGLILLYHSNGQLVYQTNADGSQSSISISVAAMPSGLYFLIFKNDAKIITNKILFKRNE